MKKIIIIGSPGAGKSTFSFALAEKTGLPLYHIDKLFWKAGWVSVEKEELDMANFVVRALYLQGCRG